MEIHEFHAKMKQHCDRLSGNCSQCCFLDYCYSPKAYIYDDFLDEIATALQCCAGKEADIHAPVIRNRHNVCQIAAKGVENGQFHDNLQNTFHA